MTNEAKTISTPASRAEIAKQREQIATELQRAREHEDAAENALYSISEAERVADLHKPRAERQTATLYNQLKEAQARRLYLEKVSAILRNNYRRALAAEVLPVFLEILSKYNGKQAGEKTRDKISDEVLVASNCFVYFSQQYDRTTVTISQRTAQGYGGENVELFGYGAPLTDDNNKITAQPVEAFTCYLCEYIADPTAAIIQMQELEARADKLRQELRETVSQFNALAVEGIRQLNY